MAKRKERDPDRELGRLCSAIQKARLQLRFMRQKRLDMVRQFVGAHYAEDGAEKTVPVNLLAMAANIIGRKLIPKNPRLMLSTFERQYRPAVSILESWANSHIEGINLANTFRRVVADALYFIGVCKVGIATPAEASSAGWAVEAGQPFIERVDLDDFAFDTHARDFSECGWMAHRSRVTLESVRNSPYFGESARQLTATEDKFFNLEGDERIQMIGRGYYDNQEEYEDFVDIWEVYLRREKVIVTLLDDNLTGASNEAGISDNEHYGNGRRRALREQKWLGPITGPYHILNLGQVPGNAMGKGPLHDIYDLHLAVNNIVRKLIRQAQDTKKLTMISAGKTEDGKRVTDTPDGHAVVVDDPKAVTQAVLGEPNQALGLLLDSFINRASWLEGNLELLGGLGPQAKTATQDKLSEAASSSQIGSLQDDTLSFVADVLRSWIWFQHHHPTNVHKAVHQVPGLERVSIVRRSFPDNPDVHRNQPGLVVRNHDFEAMQIKVDPYSLQYQTPQERAQKIIDAVTKLYLPMAQLAQQQGIGLDLNVVFRKLGKYWDDPDLEEIFSFAQKPPAEGGGENTGASGVGAQESPAGPKEPTEIIRRSLGADSQQAKESLLSNMMAKGVQNGTPQQVGAP